MLHINCPITVSLSTEYVVSKYSSFLVGMEGEWIFNCYGENRFTMCAQLHTTSQFGWEWQLHEMDCIHILQEAWVWSQHMVLSSTELGVVYEYCWIWPKIQKHKTHPQCSRHVNTVRSITLSLQCKLPAGSSPVLFPSCSACLVTWCSHHNGQSDVLWDGQVR